MATVLCNCGAAWLNRLLDGTDVRTTYFIGWGESTGTVSKGATLIDSEAQARVSAPSSQTAFNVAQWTATMTASAVRSITIGGLFATESGPLMVAGDFGPTAVNTFDTIQFTVTLTTSG